MPQAGAVSAAATLTELPATKVRRVRGGDFGMADLPVIRPTIAPAMTAVFSQLVHLAIPPLESSGSVCVAQGLKPDGPGAEPRNPRSSVVSWAFTAPLQLRSASLNAGATLAWPS